MFKPWKLPRVRRQSERRSILDFHPPEGSRCEETRLSFHLPDRAGVQEHQVIDKIHEKLALALKTWIDCKRTDPGKR